MSHPPTRPVSQRTLECAQETKCRQSTMCVSVRTCPEWERYVFHLSLSLKILQIFWVKNADFYPKMVENDFEIICIYTATKKPTSNFADTFVGHAICTYLKIIPYWTSKRQCIFKIFQIFVDFSLFSVYLFLNILQIQTYEYQNIRISVLFCIQQAFIKWYGSGCNNRLLLIRL